MSASIDGDSDDDGSWDVGLCRDDWDVADDDYSDHWGYADECNDLYYDEESDGGCDDNYWGESDDDPVDLLADQLATTHIDKTDNTSTMSVYRAAIVGENWDCLEPHTSLTDHQVKYRMRACSGGGTMSMAALEQHIRMGWANNTRSSFISFTTDPNWAAYYTLMREFVGGQVRKLYRLEVPTAQLMTYGGSNGMCTAFTRTASEVFAHRFVDVYDFRECTVEDRVRRSSKAWFSQRKREADRLGITEKYPFAEWLSENFALK